MAGSLSHITNDDGTFRMDLIENLGDAQEALEECHQIIAVLLDRGYIPARVALEMACRDMSFPTPTSVPVIQPTLHGVESAYRS